MVDKTLDGEPERTFRKFFNPTAGGFLGLREKKILYIGDGSSQIRKISLRFTRHD
ncbi:MAG: hypothetical protein FWD68_14055 [Alphaproteobacteria bacterium]|nr:hypothetical protein [Alphaproteobacteria bacterium]